MFSINGRNIGVEEPPYIIAELSANHNGSIENAKKLIKQANECGASAIKLQTYTAESMTIDCDNKEFRITDGLWKGYNLFQLYKEAATPYAWHEELFRYANEIGITIFSTPFDENAVDFLNELNVPAFKIASFEILDLPLIKYVASKGKPLLISTGMANVKEISDAVHVAKDAGCQDILLFHCISSYPTATKDANLRMVSYLRKRFDLEVGLSDHTLNNNAAIASLALGATAFEKHFLLSRSHKGPDSDFSIEPNELKNLVNSTKECWEALSQNNFERTNSEKKNLVFRRSLYFVKDIKAGEKINKENTRKIRPGYGLSPKYYEEIMNKEVIRDISKGEPVRWELIKIDS